MSDSPKRSIISIDNFWNVLTWVAIPFSVYISFDTLYILPVDRVTGNIVLFTFLGLPMSYFIKNNIPVSAFFNAKSWDYYEVWYTPNDKKVSHNTPTGSDYSKNAPYYSPSYSSQLSNIYHRYHK
ncbi:MAG: hypothetical protein EB000_01940 [Alphaproteobacteria bacterium]|nr:hypothetical protein [Alphaproteobacteria bacterium]